ncbi:hypothetical protein C4588_01045 [Candidatus Parcubacteria bacterium]|nr:MAG: hypothetical protein C4588_01045 [Candidatus Parcubacteria bacterium]
MKSIIHVFQSHLDHIVDTEVASITRVSIPISAKMIKVVFTGCNWLIAYTFPRSEELDGQSFEDTTIDKFAEDGWIVIRCVN